MTRGSGMKLAAIAALTLLALPSARASEWVSLGTSVGGSPEWFVDKTSIRFAGPIRRAWFKSVHRPQSNMMDGKWVAQRIARTAFNCEEEMIRYEAVTRYNEDGTTVAAVEGDGGPLPWEPVQPDSSMEAVFKFVCAAPVPRPRPRPQQ
jgi:hypothetical protein